KVAGEPSDWYVVQPFQEPNVSVTWRGETMVSVATRSDAVAWLQYDINQRAVTSGLHYHLILHAAAAASSGRAVLLPGRSGAGKSTLVATLVARGLEYLTDDASVVDLVDGTVVPYPKPISVLPGALPVPELEAGPPPGRFAGLVDVEWLIPATSIRADAL